MNMDDTAEAMIERLDASLQRRGMTVKVQRRIGNGVNTFAEVTIRARITGYVADDYPSGVAVTDSKFITSPTYLDDGVWPGAAGGLAKLVIGDFLLVGTKRRRIEQVDNIAINDVWVRTEGRVSG